MGPKAKAVLSIFTAPEVLWFIMIMIIMVLCVSFSTVVAFGLSIPSFHSVSDNILVGLNSFLGESYLDDMKSADPIIGVLYWVLFSYFLALMVMNIFIAIVGAAYDDAAASGDQRYEVNVDEFMYGNILAKILPRHAAFLAKLAKSADKRGGEAEDDRDRRRRSSGLAVLFDNCCCVCCLRKREKVSPQQESVNGQGEEMGARNTGNDNDSGTTATAAAAAAAAAAKATASKSTVLQWPQVVPSTRIEELTGSSRVTNKSTWQIYLELLENPDKGPPADTFFWNYPSCVLKNLNTLGKAEGDEPWRAVERLLGEVPSRLIKEEQYGGGDGDGDVWDDPLAVLQTNAEVWRRCLPAWCCRRSTEQAVITLSDLSRNATRRSGAFVARMRAEAKEKGE
jgi:hypothetical protein